MGWYACHRPKPTDCRDTPLGCKSVYVPKHFDNTSNDAQQSYAGCQPSCLEWQEPVGKGRVCQCQKGFYAFGGSCKRCHDQCSNGCRGPGTAECNSCSQVRSPETGECTRSCPQNFYTNFATGECQLCHPECNNGCGAPNDASLCLPSANKPTCKHVFDGFQCTPRCPTMTSFIVGAPAKANATCAAACPASAPFYNDTRNRGTDLPSMNVAGQQCVTSCADLGEGRRASNAGGHRLRCSLPLDLQGDGEPLGRFSCEDM